MTWAPFDFFAAAVFALWLLLSLLAQTSLLRLPLLSKIDFFRMVRRYDVFAPDPEVRQVRLAMRAAGANSNPWIPVLVLPPVRPIRALWNPTQAGEAAIVRDCLALDAATRLTADARERAKNRIKRVAISRFRALGYEGKIELRVALSLLDVDGAESEYVITREILS